MSEASEAPGSAAYKAPEPEAPTVLIDRSWGSACAKCGHPSSYHGMTFCMVQAGSTDKQRCDCDGYGVRDPRCECGWMGNGVNHYHDMRLGKRDADAAK